ncbi:G protein-coupled receptor 161-like [Glandiceps talaboti]
MTQISLTLLTNYLLWLDLSTVEYVTPVTAMGYQKSQKNAEIDNTKRQRNRGRRKHVSRQVIGGNNTAMPISNHYHIDCVSMWTLGLISMDRYFAVVQPFRYPSIITVTRTVQFIACAWILGFIFALPPVYMEWVWYDNMEAICAINWEKNSTQVVIYTLSAFVVCFCAPGIVMIFAYCGIYRIARKHSKRIQAESEQVANSIANYKRHSVIIADDPTAPSTSREADRTGVSNNSRIDQIKTNDHNTKPGPKDNNKAVKTILTMVAAFFVCLTPFCITKVLKAVYVDNSIGGTWINTVAALLAFSNSSCNPVIYSITRKDFRSSFIRTLRCFKRGNSDEVVPFNG